MPDPQFQIDEHEPGLFVLLVTLDGRKRLAGWYQDEDKAERDSYLLARWMMERGND